MLSTIYLAVASCIYSFWHGFIPTSYFIFTFVSFDGSRYSEWEIPAEAVCSIDKCSATELPRQLQLAGLNPSHKHKARQGK